LAAQLKPAVEEEEEIGRVVQRPPAAGAQETTEISDRLVLLSVQVRPREPTRDAVARARRRKESRAGMADGRPQQQLFGGHPRAVACEDARSRQDRG